MLAHEEVKLLNTPDTPQHDQLARFIVVSAGTSLSSPGFQLLK